MRKRVEHPRHDLLLQREAMGMVLHDQFLETYALPPPVTHARKPRGWLARWFRE